jgi:hypothetical protein
MKDCGTKWQAYKKEKNVKGQAEYRKFQSSCLILLCHKILCRDDGLTAALQHGHRERRLARATVSHRRMVAIELGM